MRGWRFEAFQEAQGKSIAQALVSSNPVDKWNQSLCKKD